MLNSCNNQLCSTNCLVKVWRATGHLIIWMQTLLQPLLNWFEVWPYHVPKFIYYSQIISIVTMKLRVKFYFEYHHIGWDQSTFDHWFHHLKLASFSLVDCEIAMHTLPVCVMWHPEAPYSHFSSEDPQYRKVSIITKIMPAYWVHTLLLPIECCICYCHRGYFDCWSIFIVKSLSIV